MNLEGDAKTIIPKAVGNNSQRLRTNIGIQGLRPVVLVCRPLSNKNPGPERSKDCFFAHP